MSVEVMQMVSIIGKKNDLEYVIEKIFELNCFQPVYAGDVYVNLQDDFKRLTGDNPYKELYSKAKKITSQLGIEDKSVSLKNANFTINGITDFIHSLDQDVGDLLNEKDSLHLVINDINKSISSMEHFSGLDVQLNELFKVENFKIRFGRVPIESQEKLNLLYNPYVVLFQSSQDEHYLWGFYMTPHDQAGQIDKIFANLFFERIRIPDYIGTPGEAVEGLKEELKTAKDRLVEIDRLVQLKISDKVESIQKGTKWLWMQNETCLIKEYALSTKRSFVLTGWVPKVNAIKVESTLADLFSVDVCADATTAVDYLTPPTKLRNPKAIKKYEMLVETFGLPNYKEFDPTILVAITYTIFFGIMFADVGQGLVLALIGFLMWKLKGMPIGRILVPCGLAGCLGGLFFGSVFGFENALDGFYELLGVEPFRALENESKLLISSILAGTVIIAVVIVINIYTNFKQKDYKHAIFGENGIAGLTFYVSLIALVIMKVKYVNVPLVPYVLLLIVLPLIIIFFKDPISKLIDKKRRDEKINWKETLTMGPIEMFEVLLSFFSNTVSFVRIGAFVLVHIGMMTAVFAIASIFSGAAYVLIIIFGNIFVITLEALLVGVQALRLEYYEMFSRFYKGDGARFKPLNINTQFKSEQ